MLNNCNNQEKNNNFCKVILTIITILVFGGFIFLFIKPLIGILSIIIAGGLNLYLNKRFPDFVKEIKKGNKKKPYRGGMGEKIQSKAYSRR